MKNLVLLFSFFFAVSAINAQNIPIDYEAGGNGATWTWTVFENNTNPALEIIANPDPSGINTSGMVAKFTALQAGQPFAGCETMHGAGIGTFTIDSSNYLIRIMVWKSTISDVGIKLVRNDNWSLGEIKIPNTLLNQWEQLTFDFSAHFGNVYDQLVIFPDFTPRTSDNIIYFDNVFGPVGTATALGSQNDVHVQLYPNPTQGVVRVESADEIEALIVMDLSGKTLISQTAMGSTSLQFDISDLPSGLYLIQTIGAGKTNTQKLLKN